MQAAVTVGVEASTSAVIASPSVASPSVVSPRDDGLPPPPPPPHREKEREGSRALTRPSIETVIEERIVEDRHSPHRGSYVHPAQQQRRKRPAIKPFPRPPPAVKPVEESAIVPPVQAQAVELVQLHLDPPILHQYPAAVVQAPPAEEQIESRSDEVPLTPLALPDSVLSDEIAQAAQQQQQQQHPLDPSLPHSFLPSSSPDASSSSPLLGSPSPPWSFPSGGEFNQPEIHGVFIQPFQPQPQQQNAYAAHLQQLYALQQQQGPFHYSYSPSPSSPTSPLPAYHHFLPSGRGPYDATLDYVYEDDEHDEYDEEGYDVDHFPLDPAIYQEETTPWTERMKRALTPSVSCQQRTWLFIWALYEWVLFFGVLFIIFAHSLRRMVLRDPLYTSAFDACFLFFFAFFTLEFIILLRYHPMYRKEYHLIALDFLAILSILPFISILWDPLLDALPGRSLHSNQPRFWEGVDQEETPMNYHSAHSMPGDEDNNEFHAHTLASLSLILLMRTAFLVRIIRFIKQRLFVRATQWMRLKRKELHARARKRVWIVRAKERHERDKIRRRMAKEARQAAREATEKGAAAMNGDGSPPNSAAPHSHSPSLSSRHSPLTPNPPTTKQDSSSEHSRMDVEEIQVGGMGQRGGQQGQAYATMSSYPSASSMPSDFGPVQLHSFPSGSPTASAFPPPHLQSPPLQLLPAIESGLPGSMGSDDPLSNLQPPVLIPSLEQAAQLQVSRSDGTEQLAVMRLLPQQQRRLNRGSGSFIGMGGSASFILPRAATIQPHAAAGAPYLRSFRSSGSVGSLADVPSSFRFPPTSDLSSNRDDAELSSVHDDAGTISHSTNHSSSTQTSVSSQNANHAAVYRSSLAPEPSAELDEKVTPYAMSHLSSMHSTDLSSAEDFVTPRNLSNELYDEDTPPIRMRRSPSPHAAAAVDRPKVGFLLKDDREEADDVSSDESSDLDEEDWDDQYARSHVRDREATQPGSSKHSSTPTPAAIEQTILGSFTSHQLSDYTTTLLIFLILLLVYVYHLLHDIPFDAEARVGLDRLCSQWDSMEVQVWGLNSALARNDSIDVIRKDYQVLIETFLSFDTRSMYFLSSLPIVHLSLQHSSGFHRSLLPNLNWAGLFEPRDSSPEAGMNLIYEQEESTALRMRMRRSPFFVSLREGVHTFDQLRQIEAAEAAILSGGGRVAASPVVAPGYFLFQDASELQRLPDEEITRWASQSYTRSYGAEVLESVPFGLVFVQVTQQAYQVFLFHLLYIVFFLVVTSFLLFRYDLHIQKILKPIERMMVFIEKMMADPLGEIMLNEPQGPEGMGSGEHDFSETDSDENTKSNTSLGEEYDTKNWSREAENAVKAEDAARERQILKDASEALLRKRSNLSSLPPPEPVLTVAARRSLSQHSNFDEKHANQPENEKHLAIAIPLRRSVSKKSADTSPSRSRSRSPSRSRSHSHSTLRRRRGSQSQLEEKKEEGGGGIGGKGEKENTKSPLPLSSATSSSAPPLSKSGTGMKLIDSSGKPVASSTRARRFSNETSTVEKSLLKLALLLQVGFGVAGSSIISNNLVAGDLLNPIQKGRKIFAIFGFCDLKPVVQSYFDCGEGDEDEGKQMVVRRGRRDEVIVPVKEDVPRTSESFIEQIMIFINQLQAIVHGETHKYGGFINSSIGSNTLMAWKFDVEGFERLEQQYGYGPSAAMPMPSSSFASPIMQQPAMPPSVPVMTVPLPPAALTVNLDAPPSLGTEKSGTSGTSTGTSASNSAVATPLFVSQTALMQPPVHTLAPRQPGGAAALARRHSLSIVTATGPAPFPSTLAPPIPSVSPAPFSPNSAASSTATATAGSTPMAQMAQKSMPLKKRSMSISNQLNLAATSPLLAPSTPSRLIQRRGSLSRIDTLGTSTPTTSVGSAMANMGVSAMSSIPMSMSLRGMSLGVTSSPGPYENNTRRNSLSNALSERAPSPRLRSLSPGPRGPSSPMRRSSTMGSVAHTVDANGEAMLLVDPPPANISKKAAKTLGITTSTTSATGAAPSGSPKLYARGGRTPEPPSRDLFGAGGGYESRLPPLLARSESSFALSNSSWSIASGMVSPPRKPAQSPRTHGLMPPGLHPGWPTAIGLPAPALTSQMRQNQLALLQQPNTPQSGGIKASNSSGNLAALGRASTGGPPPSAPAPSSKEGSNVTTPQASGALAPSRAPSEAKLYNAELTPAKPSTGGAVANLKPPVALVGSSLSPPSHARHRSFTFDPPEIDGIGGVTPTDALGAAKPPISQRAAASGSLRAHARTSSQGDLSALNLEELSDLALTAATSANTSIPNSPQAMLPPRAKQIARYRGQVHRRASLPNLPSHDKIAASAVLAAAAADAAALSHRSSHGSTSTASSIMPPQDPRVLSGELPMSDSMSLSGHSSYPMILDQPDGIMTMDRLDLLRQASMTSHSSGMPVIASQSRPAEMSRTQSIQSSIPSTNASSPTIQTPSRQQSPPAGLLKGRTLILRPRTNSIPDILLRGSGSGQPVSVAPLGFSTMHATQWQINRPQPHWNPAMANLLAAASSSDMAFPDAPAPSPAFPPNLTTGTGGVATVESIPEVAQHPKAAQDELDINDDDGTILSDLRRVSGSSSRLEMQHSRSQSKLLMAAMTGVTQSPTVSINHISHTSVDSDQFEQLISVQVMEPNALDAELAMKAALVRSSPSREFSPPPPVVAPSSPPLSIRVPSEQATPSQQDSAVGSGGGASSGMWRGDASASESAPQSVTSRFDVTISHPDDPRRNMPLLVVTPPRTVRVNSGVRLSPITPPAYDDMSNSASHSQQISPSNSNSMWSRANSMLTPTGSRMDKKRPPALFDAQTQNQLDMLAHTASSQPHAQLHAPTDTSHDIDFARLRPLTLDHDLSTPTSPKSPKERRAASTSAAAGRQTPGQSSALHVPSSATSVDPYDPRRYSNSLAYPPAAASAIYGPTAYGPSFPSTAIPSPALRPMIGGASPMVRYASAPSFYQQPHQQDEGLSPDSANIASLTEDPNSPHNDVVRAFIRMGMHPFGQMELRRTASQALLAFSKTLVKVATDQSLDRWRRHALLKPHLTGIGGMAGAAGSDELLNRGAGMGLHIGWAIEGAIGSRHKIDATYLSPNVNLASRLAAATKQYFVALLFSHNFFKLLPQILRDRCRLVDRVVLKGSAKPMSIYTFDIFLDQPPGNGAGIPNMFGGATTTHHAAPSATPSPPPEAHMPSASPMSGNELTVPLVSGGATPLTSHTRASSRGGAGWAPGDLAELGRLSASPGSGSTLAVPSAPLPPMVPHFSLEATVHASLDQDMAKLQLNRRSSLTGHAPREVAQPAHIRRRTSVSQAAAAAHQQQQVEMALLATQQQQHQQVQALQLQHHLQYIQAQQQMQMQSQQQDLAAVFDVPNSDPSIELLSPSPIPPAGFDLGRRPSVPVAFTFSGAPGPTSSPPPPPPELRLPILPPPPPTSLTTDPILQKLLFVLFSLQHQLPNPLFILTHNHATNAYIHGDWYLARQLYEQILQWHKTDGPARVVLQYMSTFGYQAPADWPGYRKLEKK
jgi:hypothetical protein